MKLGAVEFVDTAISRAQALGASDVHIDPFPIAGVVRYRLDGLLREICTIPRGLFPEVIARIKILAGLRTDVHQTPQDGRFRYGPVGSEYDIRVSILPTQHGENAVIRILSKRHAGGTLESLGFFQSDIESIQKALKKKHGLILIAGPTGSGKTTTLYTLLTMLNDGLSSIVTLEDPVEYSIEGIRQVQVNHKHGVTFATGLRAILRQDPDIIMVGEIRDSETAKIAIHSALTGHLVISTIHTNSASKTLPRLIDMEIDPYLISATVSLVVAQRLVRTICTECLKVEPAVTVCVQCGMSGYKGRTGIYETLFVDETVAKTISKGAASKKDLVSRSMREDALEKISRGITSEEELVRVLSQ